MATFVDSLERRVLFAATPTRYDVTIADNQMTIVAHGESASVSLYGNSHGGGVFEEEYYVDDPSMGFDGVLYVNGRRQPSGYLVLKYNVARSLELIDYRGTPGRDVVDFQCEDVPFGGIFDITTGPGDDVVTLNPVDGYYFARRSIIVGGAGNDRISVGGYEGGGSANVEIYPGAGRDKVYVTGQLGKLRLQDDRGATYVSIADAVFRRGVRITTGPQDDSLLIHNSRFTHSTSIFAGAGRDTLTQAFNTLPRGSVLDLGEDQ